MSWLSQFIYIGNIMNIGFYIKSLSEDKQLQHIAPIINKNIEDNIISDASIFYDGVGFVPHFLDCGLFNSTDLWGFRGTLVTMNIDCLKKSIKIVNNIKTIFYYGWENVDVFNLLYVVSQKIPIICKTDEDKNKIYRLTKYNANVVTEENFVDIIKDVL